MSSCEAQLFQPAQVWSLVGSLKPLAIHLQGTQGMFSHLPVFAEGKEGLSGVNGVQKYKSHAPLLRAEVCQGTAGAFLSLVWHIHRGLSSPAVP